MCTARSDGDPPERKKATAEGSGFGGGLWPCDGLMAARDRRCVPTAALKTEYRRDFRPPVGLIECPTQTRAPRGTGSHFRGNRKIGSCRGTWFNEHQPSLLSQPRTQLIQPWHFCADHATTPPLAARRDAATSRAVPACAPAGRWGPTTRAVVPATGQQTSEKNTTCFFPPRFALGPGAFVLRLEHLGCKDTCHDLHRLASTSSRVVLTFPLALASPS